MTATGRAGRVVFALLVCATIGAFFLASRVKGTPATVVRYHVASLCSPPGGGLHACAVAFRLRRMDDVTVRVVDASGEAIRTLVANRPLRAYKQLRVVWDGRTAQGGLAPAGSYQYRITLRRGGRSILLPAPARLQRSAAGR